MKIVLTQDELQAIVTEALSNQGIDTGNATFEFDNGAEIELNATSKPTKQKRTRKTKQEVIVGTSDEFDDSGVVMNEPHQEPEEEINDFEDEPEEELTEETDSDDDSDSLFD